MPERVFRYNNTQDLVKLIGDLSTALATGWTQEMRNNHTGWLRTVKALTPVEIKNSIRDARFEIYLRGHPKDGSQPDAQCAGLEPTNPLHEKVMRVESLHRTPPYGLPPEGGYYW